MEGATGTFCNCQRANLSDERLLHAASRPRTTPAIIISYTIVSRSPRGGRGWVAGERVMAAICTLYSRIPGQPVHGSVWIYARASTRTPSSPFDSSGVTTFDTFAEISSGWRQRVEFDGFLRFWRLTFSSQRLLLIALEWKRVARKECYRCVQLRYVGIKWNRINFKSDIYRFRLGKRIIVE